MCECVCSNLTFYLTCFMFKAFNVVLIGRVLGLDYTPDVNAFGYDY